VDAFGHLVTRTFDLLAFEFMQNLPAKD
jgi:hypothetical protein